MKRIMLTGAIIGFGLGLTLGWLRGSPASATFWQSCVAAYAGGLLMRWWGRIWFKSLWRSCEERLAAAALAAKKANPVPPNLS
jgi:hypothetical protein